MEDSVIHGTGSYWKNHSKHDDFPISSFSAIIIKSEFFVFLIEHTTSMSETVSER